MRRFIIWCNRKRVFFFFISFLPLMRKKLSVEKSIFRPSAECFANFMKTTIVVKKKNHHWSLENESKSFKFNSRIVKIYLFKADTEADNPYRLLRFYFELKKNPSAFKKKKKIPRYVKIKFS